MLLILRWLNFAAIVVVLSGCDLFDSDNDSTQSFPTPPSLSDNADLADLALDAITLDQIFQSGITSYTASVPFLTDSTTVTPTTDDANATVTVNGAAVVSGAASSPIALAEGLNTITIVVTAEDGSTNQTYAVEVTRQAAAAFAEQAILSASNEGGGDEFGSSIALSGDTLVVSAVDEDSSATGGESDNSSSSAGAVYVFVRTGGVWAQEAYIKASNADAGDNFGTSVDIAGDTLVVSARSESSAGGAGEGDNSEPNAGAVYVFTRSGTTWTQQAFLKADNAEGGDNFGSAVALSGDTLVVGATGEDGAAGSSGADNTESASGAAYVFTRSAGVWTQQARLKASNAERIDLFGGAVAIDGDTVVVGSLGEDSNPGAGENDNSVTDSGAAYVFTRNAGTWTQQALIKISDAEASDQFGYTVSLDGDTLIVGAPQPGTSAEGKAGVFTRTGTVWTQEAILTASNADPGDEFGWSVAVSDDTAVVGARREDSNGTGGEADNSSMTAGAAYVFTRSGSTWTQQVYLKSSVTASGDAQGHSVALESGTVAVGALGSGTGGNVIVFE